MGFKTSCLVALLILVHTSAEASSEEMAEEEKIRTLLAHILTGKTTPEDKVQVLLINCNRDSTILKEAVDRLDMCLPKDGSTMIDLDCLSSAKGIIRRVFSKLHFQAKKTLLDCLGMNNPLLHTFEEEEENGFPPFPKLEIRRKNLGARLLQSIAEVPAPSFFENSPSPEPSSSFLPSQNPSPSPIAPFFRLKPTGPPLSEDLSASPTSGVNAPAEKKGKNYNPVIIAVAVTASVTFVVVGLLFLCCNICCKGGRNDNRPLLSLSKTDISVGASPNFFAYGSPVKDGKLELQSNMSKYFDRSCQIESNICTAVRDLDLNEASGLVPVLARSGTGIQDKIPEFHSLVQFRLKTGPDRTMLTPTSVCVTRSNIEFNEQAKPTLKPPPGRVNASSIKIPSKVSPPPPPPPERPPHQPAALSQPQPPAPPPVPPPVIVGGPPGPTGKADPHTPPPPPPKSGSVPPRPPQPISLGSNAARPSKPPSNPVENDSDAPKAKLKPFFWDKVLANPGHSMVWHHIKSGSFQFNEEMIQTLFGCTPVDKNENKPKKESSSNDPSTHYIQIIDSKKAQNLSYLLRALNVTEEEICNAVTEGNELHAELIHNLLKMAPTADEELKLKLFNGEVSRLSQADRFLKALVDIPFAFKQLEALHFMCTLQEDLTIIKGSFTSLEVACQELKNSRLFLKLLEAVLKTGNRMNDGTFRGGAQAFKLDALLKLSDVKGADGKTTLLLFVVQEIIRSEGIRAARNDSIDEASLDSEDHYRGLGLQVISCLRNELENVKRAAAIDLYSLRGTVAKLRQDLVKTREFLNTDTKNIGENSGFYRTLKSFVQNAEVDITTIVEEENRIMDLVKRTGKYFHGKAGEDEVLQLFLIVSEFLIMVDKACKQVRETPIKNT